MKMITVMLLFISIESFGCDRCNVFVNIFPSDYKNSISIYTRNRMMIGEYNMFGQMTLTKHASHGNDPNFWNKQVIENYNTFEIRGEFYHREIWKTSVYLSGVNNHQTLGENKRYIVNGIGDPIVIQSYQLFNTLKSENTTKIK